MDSDYKNILGKGDLVNWKYHIALQGRWCKLRSSGK